MRSSSKGRFLLENILKKKNGWLISNSEESFRIANLGYLNAQYTQKTIYYKVLLLSPKESSYERKKGYLHKTTFY